MGRNVFRILQKYNYSLKDLVEQGVGNHPDQVLLKIYHKSTLLTGHTSRSTGTSGKLQRCFTSQLIPVQGCHLCDNCLEGACTDLACLSFGIFDTPLSTHFTQEILFSIFNTLKINIVVTDSKERLTLLQDLQQKTEIPFTIFTLGKDIALSKGNKYLPEACKKLVSAEMDQLLMNLPEQTTEQVATDHVYFR